MLIKMTQMIMSKIMIMTFLKTKSMMMMSATMIMTTMMMIMISGEGHPQTKDQPWQGEFALPRDYWGDYVDDYDDDDDDGGGGGYGYPDYFRQNPEGQWRWDNWNLGHWFPRTLVP